MNGSAIRHLVPTDFLTEGEVADPMSPPRDKTISAAALSVPILIVIAMLVSAVTAAISASGVYWMTRLSNQEAQYQMQSDIRSISERLNSQAEIATANKRADTAERDSQIQSYESTKQAVDTLRGAVQLMQLQVGELLKQKR